MRFSYTGLISLAPDTGEPTAIFRPEIPITLYGPLGSRGILALVDTGADNTIFPEAAARALGIPFAEARAPAARGLGGQAISLSYAEVEIGSSSLRRGMAMAPAGLLHGHGSGRRNRRSRAPGISRILYRLVYRRRMRIGPCAERRLAKNSPVDESSAST